MKIEFFLVTSFNLFILIAASSQMNQQKDELLDKHWELKKSEILLGADIPNDMEAEPFEKVYDDINKEMKHSSDEEKQSMIQTLQTVYDNLPTFPSEIIQVWIKNVRHKMNIGPPGSERRIRAVIATKSLMDTIKEWVNWIVDWFKVNILGYNKTTKNTTTQTPAESSQHSTGSTSSPAQDQHIPHDHKAVQQNYHRDDQLENTSTFKPGSPEAKLHYIKGFKPEWDLSEKIEAVTKLEQLMEIQGTDDKFKEALRTAAHEIKKDPIGAAVYYQIIVKTGQDPFPLIEDDSRNKLR